MKIKVNSIEIPETMLDVAARAAGFSDGLQIAIGGIREAVSQVHSFADQALLEKVACKMEQEMPWAVKMYVDGMAEKYMATRAARERCGK